MFGTLLLAAVASLVWLFPGAAVALTWHPREPDPDGPLRHVALGLAWGCGLVPLLAFAYAVSLQRPLTPWVVVAASAAVTAGALLLWWFRRRGAVPRPLGRGWRRAAPVLAACVLVGTVYLVKYDRAAFFQDSCIVTVVYQVLQVDGEPVDLLRSNEEDQRLGNTAVIGSFVAVYRGLGFRLLYALIGASIALGGYLLARTALGSRAWGWAVLLFLPLNPYVAKIPLLDENLLTLGFCSLFLPLLFRRDTPWLHVGALFGLAVMMRHAMILALPAVAWAAYRQPQRRLRSLATGGLAFLAATALGHVHHQLALGSVFRFESFGQIPDFPHRFLGDYSGLLQYPFAEVIIRTPWNPFPTFVMWPVYLIGHLGLLWAAAIPLGAVALWRRDRGTALFWALWAGPLYLALSLQENWDVPNKMGVIYLLFHPVILLGAMGLAAALRQPRRWGVALLVASLALAAGVWGVRGWRVGADQRYYQAWPGERWEDPEYVAAERRATTRLVPWPDYRRVNDTAPMFHGRKLRGLMGDLRSPALDTSVTPYGWLPGDAVDPDADSVIVEIDLSRRLFDRPRDWITVTPGDGPVDADLTVPGPAVALTGLELPWSDRPASLLLPQGGADVTTALLVFERWNPADPAHGEILERYERTAQLAMGWQGPELREVRSEAVEDPVVRVRVRPGPLGFTEVVNNAGQLYFTWQAAVDGPGTLELDGPVRAFHN